MNLDGAALGILFLIMGATFMLMALSSKSRIARTVGFIIGAFALWIGIYDLFFVAVGA